MTDPRPVSAAEVVTLGECLAAFVASDEAPLAVATRYERHIVGAEANVAVGLTRLGHPAAFIGRVGKDGLGEAITRQLRGEGVDVSCLARDDAPTGVLIRDRRSLGPIEVVYCRRGSAGSQLKPADVYAAARLFAGARWLHLSGVTPALSTTCRRAVDAAIGLAREQHLMISLDFNLRRRLWRDDEAVAVLRPLASACDVVLAGIDEAAVVTGISVSNRAEDVARSLAALGAREAVLKLGSGGALASAPDGALVHVPAVPVPRVLDTVGAGDAFCAGYIAAALEGLRLDQRLSLAVVCGAAVAATVGDQPGLPSRIEADSLRADSEAEPRR